MNLCLHPYPKTVTFLAFIIAAKEIAAKQCKRLLEVQGAYARKCFCVVRSAME